MVLRILYPERNTKLHDWFKSNNNFNNFVHAYLRLLGPGISLLWIMGESGREGLWLLALVTGGRGHVTNGR